MIQPVRRRRYHALQTELRARGPARPVRRRRTRSRRPTNYQDNDGNPRIPCLPEKELNEGLASYDRTHNLQTYWVWDLPFGKDRRWAAGGLADAVSRRLAGQRRPGRS